MNEASLGQRRTTAHAVSLQPSVIRLPVALDEEERERYERLVRPWLRVVDETGGRGALEEPEHRTAAAHYGHALNLAAFPRAKRRLVVRLLARHRRQRVIVFAPTVDAAFRIAEDELVPVIAEEVSELERRRTLAKLADGKVRTIVASGLFLEEHEAQSGSALPAVSVAIVVSGLERFGAAPLRASRVAERVGALLRPPPEERVARVTVYELITRGTMDEPSADCATRGQR